MSLSDTVDKLGILSTCNAIFARSDYFTSQCEHIRKKWDMKIGVGDGKSCLEPGGSFGAAQSGFKDLPV